MAVIVQFLMVILVLAFFMTLLFTVSLVDIATYIFTAFPLWRIIQRRCPDAAWAAWIPGAAGYVEAALSDWYRKKNLGKPPRHLMLMLIAYFVAYALSLICSAIYIAGYVPLLFGEVFIESAPILAVILLLISIVVLLLFFVPVSLITLVSYFSKVINYISLFNIYRSCQPGMAILYVVLNILIPLSTPVCLMLSAGAEGPLWVKHKDA